MRGLDNKLSLKLRLTIYFSAIVIAISFALYFYINKKEDTEKLKTQHTSAQAQYSNTDSQNKILLKKKIIKKDGKESSSKYTENTVRTLLLIYAQNKIAGKSNLEIEKILDEIYPTLKKEPFKKYSKKDLKIIKKENFDPQAYKNALKEALKPLANIKRYELEPVALFIKNKDKEALDEIKLYMNLYDTSVRRLLKIAVPDDFAKAHLALINAYLRFKRALEIIVDSENDIILAYPGLDEFMRAEADIQSAHGAIDLYLKTYGVNWLKRTQE